MDAAEQTKECEIHKFNKWTDPIEENGLVYEYRDCKVCGAAQARKPSYEKMYAWGIARSIKVGHEAIENTERGLLLRLKEVCHSNKPVPLEEVDLSNPKTKLEMEIDRLLEEGVKRAELRLLKLKDHD